MWTALLLIVAASSAAIAQDDDNLICLTCSHNEEYSNGVKDPSCVSGSTTATSKGYDEGLPNGCESYIDDFDDTKRAQLQDLARRVQRNETVPQEERQLDPGYGKRVAYCAFIGYTQKSTYKSMVVRLKIKIRLQVSEGCKDIPEDSYYSGTCCLCRTDNCNNQPYGINGASASLRNSHLILILMLFGSFTLPKFAHNAAS